MTVLKGQALLDYLNANTGKPRDELIIGAGYATTRQGKQSVQRTRFFEALAAANGHQLGDAPAPGRTGPRTAGYILTVGPKGLIPVGRAYTEQCKMAPGSQVRVIIEGDAIVLEPASEEDLAARDAAAAAPATAAPAVCTPPAAKLASVA